MKKTAKDCSQRKRNTLLRCIDSKASDSYRKFQTIIIFRDLAKRKEKSMVSELVKGQKLSSPYLVKRRYRLHRLEKVYSFTRWDRSAPKCIVIVNALEEMNDHANHPRNDDPLSSISIVFQRAIKRLHDATQWTRSAPISKCCIVVHECKPTVDSPRFIVETPLLHR